MKRKRFTDEQIIGIRKEAEAGAMIGPPSVRSTRYETVEIAEGQHSGSVAV